MRQASIPRVLCAAALVSAAAAAHADTLSSGSAVISPAGTDLALDPQLAGTIVQDVVTPFRYDGWYRDISGETPVEMHGDVNGSVQSRVVRTDAGTYDFYWRITVDRGAFLPVANFRLGGFGAADYNANWRSDGDGIASPAMVQEGSDGAITWSFGQYLPPSQEINPGQTSFFFFLGTDAHAYAQAGSFSLESERDSGGSMMIDWGGSSGNYATFAPAVPEPASLALMLSGVTALVLALRRRG